MLVFENVNKIKKYLQTIQFIKIKINKNVVRWLFLHLTINCLIVYSYN